MRSTIKDRVAEFIRRKGICQASDIMREFDRGRVAVAKYLKGIGALTSFNSKGQYYILPQYHPFDENDLLFIGKVGFYRGGNLLAAICHLVESSPKGLGARELDSMLKTTTHSQLPGLHRTGRLRRELAGNRPGHAYIYFSLDPATSRAQRDALLATSEKLENVPEEELAADELPDVIEVLLTLIAHPDFSAKSAALSLQRRGLKISGAFAKRVFQKYGLSKKKP